MWLFSKKKPVAHTPVSGTYSMLDKHGFPKDITLRTLYYQELGGLHAKIQAGSVKTLKSGEAYYPLPETYLKTYVASGHWNSLGDLMPVAKPKHIDLFS